MIIMSSIIASTMVNVLIPSPLVVMVIIPMTIADSNGLYLPVVFALATGLPVMLFAYLLAYSASKVGKAFNVISKIEKGMRYFAGIVFVLTGIYNCLIFLEWI